MTGFGRGTAARRGLKAIVELKAVNHKQFDCRIELPPELIELEPEIRERVHAQVDRGHVVCRVHLDYSAGIRRRAARVDEALARAYLARLRRIAVHLKLKDDLTSASLLALPQVVRYETLGLPLQLCRPLIRRGLERALQNLRGMQAREGRLLGRDLLARWRQLLTLTGRIERRAPAVSRAYLAALRKRIAAAGLEMSADDPRLLKEVALFADRSDIMEEITRLRSHLRQGREWLGGGGRDGAAGGRAGRTLDFLVQELFREINTIGSKANDQLIAEDVIRFKAELERIREQVQNLV
jgi:uncharacterized protein (TIGR00255 family)